MNHPCDANVNNIVANEMTGDRRIYLFVEGEPGDGKGAGILERPWPVVNPVSAGC